MEWTIKALVALAVAVVLWGAHWSLMGRHKDMGRERKFYRQLIMLGLTVLAILGWILLLPVEESLRNRLVGLIGLLLSGMIAFSSTNILANLMGGILLRITRPFDIGDFIRVGHAFGRVTERGLFDTEIQTENRELLSMPNAYLVRQPVTMTPKAGGVVSTSLSLGYDNHHARVTPLLLQAAQAAGLDDPFVYIIELKDFSVVYRVAGFLAEPKHILSARSNLCRAVLDSLHGAGIEIVSPTFMAQRQEKAGVAVVPEALIVEEVAPIEVPEEKVFDKAEKAEKKEHEKKVLLRAIENYEAALKETRDEKQRAVIEGQLARTHAFLKRIEQQSDEEERDT